MRITMDNNLLPQHKRLAMGLPVNEMPKGTKREASTATSEKKPHAPVNKSKKLESGKK
jgi:hypothetical protein